MIAVQDWNHMCANMVATRPSAPDLFRCIEHLKVIVDQWKGTHGKLLEELKASADSLVERRAAMEVQLAQVRQLRLPLCLHFA